MTIKQFAGHTTLAIKELQGLLVNGVGTGSKPLATSNLKFYVATTGSDTNPGTITSPFATLQAALTAVSGFDYSGGFQPEIFVSDGTYTYHSHTLFLPELTGFINFVASGCFIHGNFASPGNVVFVDADGNGGFYAYGPGAQYELRGVTIDTPSTGFIANNGATFQIDQINYKDSTNSGNGVCFTASNGASVFLATSGADTFSIVAPTTQMAAFAGVSSGGFIYIGSAGDNIVFPAALNFSDAFVNMAGFDSIFDWNPPSVTNAGGVTGRRIDSSGGGLIQTLNGLVTDLPGTSNGQLSSDLLFSLDNFTSRIGHQGSTFAGLLTTSQLSPGCWSVFKDTSGGGVYVAYNDAGVIKKVALT